MRSGRGNLLTYKIIEDNIEYDVTNNEYGDQYWRRNYVYDRVLGPAIIHARGDKFWFRAGLMHNDSGPAFVSVDGKKYWYQNDMLINCKTQEEFEQYLRLKAFW